MGSVAAALKASAATLAVALSALLPAPAAAEAAPAIGFRGSCALAGEVAFDRPLGPMAGFVRAEARAGGTCSGTLTTPRGRELELAAAPARYRATSEGQQSCAAAFARGEGWLRVDGRRRLRFSFAENRVLTMAPLRLTGRRSGTMIGTAAATGDPVATIESCAGDGLSWSPVAIRLATEPAISG